MISQKCPRCGSKRVRRGYRPTPIWLKIFCRYYLLCDGCNWEFTGFAVPFTVSTKPAKKRKPEPRVEEALKPKTEENTKSETTKESASVGDKIETPNAPANNKKKKQKRVKVKL